MEQSPTLKFRRKKYTREEIKLIVREWDNKTIEELAAMIRRPISSIGTIAKALRKNGLSLSPKRTTETTRDDFFKDVAAEIAASRVAK